MRTMRLAAVGLCILFVLAGAARGLRGGSESESGTLSIYFMDEKVGYEEYTWSEEPGGYVLKVSGRMTKPFRLDVESLTIRLSRDFIPAEYSFKGALNGMAQDVMSSFSEGRVRNTINSGGQETIAETQVRRDTFILPMALFSPYLVLAKKYGCGLKDKAGVSAYMIPQVEIAGSLQGGVADPCILTLDLAGVQIILQTDADRRLLSLSIPSQNLKVTGSETGSSGR